MTLINLSYAISRKLKPLKKDLEGAYITFVDGLRGDKAVAADQMLFDDVVLEIRKWGRPVRLDFHKPGKTDEESVQRSIFFSVKVCCNICTAAVCINYISGA